MRIDRLLWFLRLVKTRSLAQRVIEQGHVRLNGRRVERAAHPVAVGDIVVVPLQRGVLVLEIAVLPVRRGPAQEARACYRVLDEVPAHTVAASRIELSFVEIAKEEGELPR